MEAEALKELSARILYESAKLLKKPTKPFEKLAPSTAVQSSITVASLVLAVDELVPLIALKAAVSSPLVRLVSGLKVVSVVAFIIPLARTYSIAL